MFSGGPGCNKTKLTQRVLYRAPGWIFINTGTLLRDNVDSNSISIDTAEKIRDTIASGHLIDKVSLFTVIPI